MVPDTPSPLQLFQIPMLPDSDTNVWIKRDDMLSPFPGNKGRKLKYHIEAMRKLGTNRFYTFGGPFSNHLVAASTLCKRYGMEGTGYVRGSIEDNSNPVLNKAIELIEND